MSQGQTAEQGAEQWIFLGLGLVAAIAVTTVITRIARRALAEATGQAEGIADSEIGVTEIADTGSEPAPQPEH